MNKEYGHSYVHSDDTTESAIELRRQYKKTITLVKIKTKHILLRLLFYLQILQVPPTQVKESSFCVERSSLKNLQNNSIRLTLIVTTISHLG